jgi:Leucine-rich repeat (LRR) protein
MDLTKLTGLEKFGASWLNIKTLDFSKNKNLTSVFMEHCPVKTVDFSKNKNLTTVLFDRCCVKTLDFSNNKKLIDVGCEGKKTKEIILPKNNKIKYFRWSNAGLLEFSMKQLNPKTLMILNLADNSITSLNLKKYTHLEYVYVDKNVEVMLPASLEETIVYRW